MGRQSRAGLTKKVITVRGKRGTYKRTAMVRAQTAPVSKAPRQAGARAPNYSQSILARVGGATGKVVGGMAGALAGHFAGKYLGGKFGGHIGAQMGSAVARSPQAAHSGAVAHAHFPMPGEKPKVQHATHAETGRGIGSKIGGAGGGLAMKMLGGYAGAHVGERVGTAMGAGLTRLFSRGSTSGAHGRRRR